MVKAKIRTLEVEKEIELDMALLPTVPALSFSGKIDFQIMLDRVDLDEFLKLCDKTIKKGPFDCILKRDEKEFKGKRKFFWKQNLVVSQGGIQLQFYPESVASMKAVLEKLREKK